MRGSINTTVSGHTVHFPLVGCAPGLPNRVTLLPHPPSRGSTCVYPTWEPQCCLQMC